MHPSDQLAAGRVLDGRYRVDRLIARGGMATVYLARDLRLDRPVALKAMHPVLADDPDFVRRFVGEARSAARLSHPCVVAVHDQGTADGVVYLAMEYVDGSNLRDLLSRRGRLGPGEALGIVADVLSALTAAHEAGLAHRDVKPENILVTAEGAVKVADFGLARAISTDSRSAATAGLLIGTVAYLAPEQVEHGVANELTDVYSVGIVLFECLTGSPPYSGSTPLSVAYQHVHGRIPAPSEVLPGIPAALDQLVARSTARDPADRFTNAREFSAGVLKVRALPELVASAPATAAHATVILDLSDGSQRSTGRPTAAMGLESGVATAVATATELLPTTTSDPSDPMSGESDPPSDRGDGELMEGPPARHRRLWAAFILLGLAVLAGGGGWAWGSTQYTDVPSLIGKTREQAVGALDPLGLKLEINGEQYSEDVAKGLIAATEPEPMGRVRNGGVVNAQLSLGPERHDVPTVRGMTLDEARAALNAATLRVGSVSEEHSDKVAAGQIMGVDPKTGTPVKRDTAVALVVSKGPAPVAMPKLTGLPITRATKTLEAAGLLSNRTDEYSDSVPTDVVIRTTPTADTMIHRRDTVTVVVSKGPPPVPVPDVVRLGTSEAKAKLQAAGFKVVVRNQLPVVMFNRVYSQYPGAGSQAPRGSTITINIV